MIHVIEHCHRSIESTYLCMDVCIYIYTVYIYSLSCTSESIFLAKCSTKRSEQFNTKFIQSLFKNYNSLFRSMESSGGCLFKWNKLPDDSIE